MSVLFDAAVKGTILLGIAALLALLMRRASAASRHLVWCVAVAATVAIPLLSWALPGWQLLVVPPGLSTVLVPAPVSMPADRALRTSRAEQPERRFQPADPGLRPARSGEGTAPDRMAASVGRGSAVRQASVQENPPPGSMWLTLAWLVGAVLMAAPILTSTFFLWRITRRVPPLTEGPWVTLLHELMAELGVKRPVTLRQSEQVSLPVTWGFLRPVILIPADGEQWSDGRCRAVLLHELAHVQRADCLTQMLAQIACVLYWFHPLVWLAARQLRIERERACDDRVLEGGTKASEYAQHLLEIARAAYRANRDSLAAVAMARPSQLESRLLAVLDAKRRRRPVSRLATCIAVAVGAGLVLPLAALEAAPVVEGNAGAEEVAARQRPTGGMVIRQVWATPSDVSGTVSADGRHLSFVDWETGDLAIRELGTESQRRLTNKGSWETSKEYALESTISPDGRQVAYTWMDKDESMELRLVGLDHSEPRVLYRSTEVGWIELAEWSAGGQQVLALLHQKAGPVQIALVSVADGSVRVLKSLERRAPRKMSLSPDGRSIVCDFQARQDVPERDIYLLDTGTGREAPLVEHPANDLSPLWTPDGKRVLFVSDRTGTFGIWAVNVTAGKPDGSPELVKADLGLIHPLGFTRDGSLYFAFPWKEEVYTATLDPEAGRIVAPPRSVSPRFVGANSRPAWSPDGRYLAYLTSRGDRVQPPLLSIRSLDSGKVRELSPQLRRIATLQWSSDGRSLLATGVHPKSGEGAFRINARTGAVTSFPGSEKEVRFPAWSRDERTVSYVDLGPAARYYRIVARDLKTGDEKELHRGNGRANGLCLSPDGRQLAVAEADASPGSRVIRAMRATGGVPREFCRVKEEGSFGALTLRWTPDGQQLLFGWNSKRATELWRVPVGGGEPQRLGEIPRYARHLAVHPDGKQMSFHASISDGGAGVWVMENFLPAAQAMAPASRR
jgi:Tol biopolymer transport system component/beta-lactamase regulating signal transducer with metallopeptidase domain